MKLISIIVPIYNAEPYLSRCLDSLLAQTYKNLELILINDGSTDSSGVIADKYAKENSNVLVVHSENFGVSAARNKGLDLAKGELVSFVDSDDYVDHRIYEKLYYALKENEAEISTCGRNIIKNNRVISRIFTSKEMKVYSSYEAAKEMMLIRALDTSVCDKLFKAKLFKENRFPIDRKVNEETIVLYNCFRDSNRIVHIGEPLYNCYIGNKSATRAGFSTKFFGAIDASKELLQLCEKYTPQLTDYAYAFYINECLGVMSRAAIDVSKQYKNVIKEISEKLKINIRKSLKNPYIRRTHKFILVSSTVSTRLYIMEMYMIRLIKNRILKGKVVFND